MGNDLKQQVDQVFEDLGSLTGAHSNLVATYEVFEACVEEERRSVELVRNLARMISKDVAVDLPPEYRARVLRCLRDMIEIRRSWLDAATELVTHLEQVQGEDGEEA